MTNNYFCYHIHSDLSNAVTNIDSVTKFGDYVEAAKSCGMTTFGFSEHGSVMEWLHKKEAIEAAGMKYVHAVEAYLTESLDEKVRDNYHCVLIARNYDGFLELNRMISKSFNRNDNHFYYVPRISFDELFSCSDNIIITTACVGGVFGKGSEEVQDKFLDFLILNRHRTFLEIGHHIDEKQKSYNNRLLNMSRRSGIKLIAGTDTHALNNAHVEGRKILQLSKKIHFEGEDNWDLRFKTYDELVQAYELQGTLPSEVYMEAISNTNLLADMIEPFEVDRNPKYPHIYNDPEKTFREKIQTAIDTHPYALKNHTREEIESAVEQEIEVFKKTKSIDFMLMQTYLREWEKKNGINCGPGRGSVSGSMVAYLLGITQMDSLRFNLNFFRFSNPDRVSLADIDTDYAGKDRDRVKEFLLKEKMGLDNIKTAEIITFNTIALRGAIKDVCRALYSTEEDPSGYIKTADEIIEAAEADIEEAKKKYKGVFRYVDIVNGTIVSIGTHPSGVLVCDLPIDEFIGLCSVSSSDYPVTMLNMKELDSLMVVKLDCLGLDNWAVANETCKLLGIPPLTPDNIDLEDMNVWKSIRDDTTLIFQWESNSAQQYIRKFMSDKTLDIARSRIPNFSMLKWCSFGNGLLRPACASFRDSVANGVFYDNGFDALNEFLAPEAGRIAMQETIMQFLVKFCGYSAAESDTVRRAIAKKKGTETLLPEIERRFVEYCMRTYKMTEEQCESIIKPFIQIILDASAYGFSWNHSDAYSVIGYICGYLRYYHPLEFLTASLNIFGDDLEKTGEIIKYANKVGIKVTMPKWGISKNEYICDEERHLIAKGMNSIKFMSKSAANELYDLAHKNTYSHFTDVLKDIKDVTSVNSRQVDILIGVDFFSDFGNQRELMYVAELFRNLFSSGDAKKLRKSDIDGTFYEPIIQKYSVGVTKSGGEAKFYTLLDIASIMRECEDMVKEQKMEDLSDVLKVRKFIEAMGYAGYVTGKEEDRRKLYVMDIKPIKKKATGKTIGKSVFTKSIGSGKESRFTIWNAKFDKRPIKKEDVIWCKSYSRDGSYFTLENYEILS